MPTSLCEPRQPCIFGCKRSPRKWRGAIGGSRLAASPASPRPSSRRSGAPPPPAPPCCRRCPPAGHQPPVMLNPHTLADLLTEGEMQREREAYLGFRRKEVRLASQECFLAGSAGGVTGSRQNGAAPTVQAARICAPRDRRRRRAFPGTASAGSPGRWSSDASPSP